MHVHVSCSDGEAKFWLEPEVSLARSHGLSEWRINELAKIVKEHKEEIANAWRKHFRS